MATLRHHALREQLLDRRQRLESVIAEFGEAAHLVRLLQEVNATLERMDHGAYGLCEVCHEPIEEDRLVADPFITTCLDHLTAQQRRSLEQDLELASQVQRQWLPKPHLSFNGWEIDYHYEPAGPVSGDYCDVMIPERNGGDFFFLLGDVSGKGVAASMLMAHLHAMFRSLMDVGLPVNQLVERANRVFCESTLSAQFATLVCGRADGAGEIEVCNAGHCPPLVVQGGEVTSLAATGLPIGMFCSGQYAVKTVRLAVGDSLVLYTDGLSEARGRSDAEYGIPRLSMLLKARHALVPQALIQACLEDLTDFRAGAPPTDDLAMMVLRRTG